MHRLTRYVGTFVIAAALVPTLASAITAEEVQLQIADLMARIAALNSSLNQLPGGNGSTSNSQTGNAGVNILDGSTTITLTRDIQTGSTGADVSRLQAHLSRDPNIYPEGIVTGVYKGLTTEAIKRFQVACGIVSAGGEQSTGYGRVGPLTRRALSLGCQNVNVPSQVGAYLRITPNAGAAPLTVSAEATINTPKTCEAGTYSLSFGDGTPVKLLIVPKGRCSEVIQSISHTYANAGTYQARLSIGDHKTDVAVTVGPGAVATTPTPVATTTTGTTVTTGNGYNTTASNAALQVRLVNTSTNVARGTNVVVSWDGVNPPQGSVVRIELRRADNTPLGTVASGLASSGQYVWQVPLVATGNVSCDATNGQICSSSVQDGSYRLRVYLFAPATACWGFCQAGALVPTVYAIANTDSFTVGAAAGSITADNFSATTTSGASPFTVTFDTAVNGSGSCSGGVYSIDFGDGTAKTDLPYPSGACRGVGYSVAHIYSASTTSTFTARLYNVASNLVTSATAAIKSVAVTVSAAAQVNQGPFTVTLGVNGVASNVSAVFQVLKYTCGSYSVAWGDGSTNTTRDATTAACTDASATITLTHTYAQSGTYTIRLKRGQGSLANLTNEETATVTVVTPVNSCGANCGATRNEGNSGN